MTDIQTQEEISLQQTHNFNQNQYNTQAVKAGLPLSTAILSGFIILIGAIVVIVALVLLFRIITSAGGGVVQLLQPPNESVKFSANQL